MTSQPTPYQIGKYQVLGEIGRGGMAVVYKAYDADLQRAVAIKVLPEGYANDPQFVERFQHEAIMAARLQHPNIVIIHDIGHQGNLYYIVMQYLGGANLDQVIAHSGALPLDAAAAITAQVADALDHAHRQGMIHRDIKPSNIMVAADGQVTLMDFGLVRAGESSGLTHVGMIVGTPAYMSPEQAQGIAIDHRTDIYSLGIVCGKALTGLAPFERSTPYATLLAQIHEPLPMTGAWARLPRDVRNALQRATAKSPSERTPSAGAFAAELSAAVGVKRGKVIPVALPAAQFVPVGTGAAEAPPSALPTRLLGDPGSAPAGPAPILPATASAARPPQAPSPLVAPRRKAVPVLAVAAAALALLILGAGALWAAGPRWRGAATAPATLPHAVAAHTSAPEVTPSPVLPTSTPAATATRAATATETPAPAVTLAPQIVTQVVVVTATPEPTRTATLSPTLPPATRPAPPAPTAANTAAPAQPPAPQPGALALSGPADGARFSNGWNDKIQLSWRGDFALDSNDFFVVQIRYRHGSDLWTDDQWTKESAIVVPDYLLENATTDRFEWQVMVVREDPGGTLVFSGSKRRGFPLSDASPLRMFIWTAPGGGGGGGRATATPID